MTMAKPSTRDALIAWREAEERYRTVVDVYLSDGGSAKVDKEAAVAITKARVRADKRMDNYLLRCVQ